MLKRRHIFPALNITSLGIRNIAFLSTQTAIAGFLPYTRNPPSVYRRYSSLLIGIRLSPAFPIGHMNSQSAGYEFACATSDSSEATAREQAKRSCVTSDGCEKTTLSLFVERKRGVAVGCNDCFELSRERSRKQCGGMAIAPHSCTVSNYPPMN